MATLVDVADFLREHLPLGALFRLTRVSKALSLVVGQWIDAVIARKLGCSLRFVRHKLESTAGSSFEVWMRASSHRCIECGKYRSIKIELPRRFPDTRICLACARDPTGYRYHPTRKEALQIIMRHNHGFLPKPRVLKRVLRPRMLTQTRAYLYAMCDLRELLSSDSR